MKEVFISYKSEEFEEANWVKSVLENNGISCWMAPDSIPGGSSYAVEIPKAIKECKVFVLILSSKSQTSQWISREVDRAINEGKVVLPFMLENCELKDDFNFYLTNVQRYSAYENKMKAMEKMYEEIKAILGIKSEQNDKSNNEVTSVQEIPSITSKPVVTAPVTTENQFVVPATPQNITAAKTSKSKVRRFLPAIIIAVVIIVIVASEVITTVSNTINIAGEQFKKDDGYISLSDKELTDSDMSKLGEFEDLNSVYFTNCTFPSTDISIIFEKVSHTVKLDNCSITNEHLNSVNFANVNEDLTTLNLDNNPKLTDISMIFTQGKFSIDEITVNNCGITDISCFSGAQNLNLMKFEADNNDISDISALSEYKELKHLSIANNNIDSVEALAGIKTLEYINISGNKLTNIVGLENSIFLETLNIENNQISSLDSLSNCTQLTNVNLNKNSISDISVLSKSIEKLSEISANDNNISSVLALSGAINLKKLSVDNNSLVNFEGLEKSTKLTKLSAANNQIDNIAGIANCSFTSVNLSNNKLVSTEGISFAGDTYAAVFNVSNNQISTFGFNLNGEGTIQFEEISVYGNDISDFSNLESVSGSKLVFKYNENIDFSNWSNYNFYEYYVIDCPLDKQVYIGELLGSYKTNFVTEKEFLELNDF